MAKVFKDFLFANHKLSEFGDFISIDFDGESDILLALEREMEMGETNKYRIEPNFFGDKWSSPLTFELHIIKNICTHNNQTKMMFSQKEISAITGWLTSPHYPKWINFEYSPDDKDKEKISTYKGWFNNIETYTVGELVYGLKLCFTCVNSFGYSDERTVLIDDSSSILTSKTIENNSDEFENYCYPQIYIHPNSTNQCFICNLTDSTILEKGALETSSLQDIAEAYALKAWSSIRYAGSDSGAPNLLCGDNALQFYLTNKYGDETKCTILYDAQTAQYYIIEGGFMYMDLKANLDIVMDCQRLLIQDSIGRMVTYDDLGIMDVDNMYWLRLKHGINNFLIYGDMTVTFKYREARKVGE